MWCSRIASIFRFYLQTQRLPHSLPVSKRPSRTSLARIVRYAARWHNTAACKCCLDPPRRCWKCNVDMNTQEHFFCPACHVIQPPNKESTHFEIMDSPTSFDMNTGDLTKKYKALQWKLHPDKFSSNQKDEQDFSDQQASLVNKAYHTLLKPLTRGLYLLELNGFPLHEGTSDAHPEFLMEIMEINERLTEDLSEEKLTMMELENRVQLDQCIAETSAAFERGARRDTEVNLNNNAFQTIQECYWEKLLNERRKTAMNKRRFQEMGEKDFKSLIDEFPEFNESDIIDLRLQFQTFDINQDGIIDFKELMQVLDDLGDRSEPEVRQDYFSEIDKDGSGAIDFEEFLGLIYQLREETDKLPDISSDKLGDIGSLCKRGTDNIQRVRKLSVAKQMMTGLF